MPCIKSKGIVMVTETIVRALRGNYIALPIPLGCPPWGEHFILSPRPNIRRGRRGPRRRRPSGAPTDYRKLRQTIQSPQKTIQSFELLDKHAQNKTIQKQKSTEPTDIRQNIKKHNQSSITSRFNIMYQIPNIKMQCIE